MKQIRKILYITYGSGRSQQVCKYISDIITCNEEEFQEEIDTMIKINDYEEKIDFISCNGDYIYKNHESRDKERESWSIQIKEV